MRARRWRTLSDVPPEASPTLIGTRAALAASLELLQLALDRGLAPRAALTLAGRRRAMLAVALSAAGEADVRSYLQSSDCVWVHCRDAATARLVHLRCEKVVGAKPKL